MTTLNNIGVLIKSVLIDLRARNFAYAKTYLRAGCVQTRHCERNLLTPVKDEIMMNK